MEQDIKTGKTENMDETFKTIVELGANMVRTDFSWNKLEPKQGEWDKNMLDFHQRFINRAKNFGLEVIVILSHPPDWALNTSCKYIDNILSCNPNNNFSYNPVNYFEYWKTYAQNIAKYFGDYIYYYQLANEPNTPHDNINREHDRLSFKYAYEGIKDYDNEFETIVNPFYDCNYPLFSLCDPAWEDSVNKWLAEAGKYIDIIGFDHYPSTWTTSPAEEWEGLQTLIVRTNTKGNKWYGKKIAIMETGFSSWSDKGIFGANLTNHLEENQSEWINRAIPYLRKLINTTNSSKQFPVVMLNYYELNDGDSNQKSSSVPTISIIENNFGVRKSNKTRKPAFDDLKYQFHQTFISPNSATEGAD